MKIPFVKPPLVGNEDKYILDALKKGYHSGGGYYSKECTSFLEENFNIGKALLTTSCTDALEMASFLINGEPGDEFIVPSYTFSSTANAFVSRGMVPVFCDIDPITLNIDSTKIEELITDKTKAIVPIHYAGIPAEMNEINNIAKKYNLIVIEDAAQAVNSKYYDKYAGNLADLGTFSFHATKSYSCGEGGALTINRPEFYQRSEYLLEKGTDRSLVVNGQKNKYSWVDNGSSFLISDLLSSMLYSQLLKLDDLQHSRKKLFDNYYQTLENIEINDISYIHIPDYIKSNYHAFWILLKNESDRDFFIKRCLDYNFTPYIGYVALHSSIMGKKVGIVRKKLNITEDIEKRVVRLPFYIMDDDEINYSCEVLKNVLLEMYKK